MHPFNHNPSDLLGVKKKKLHRQIQCDMYADVGNTECASLNYL